MTPAGRNPFRADRLDTLAWVPPGPGGSAAAVIDTFRRCGWRGAIVGPHGTGKSTLLRTLADAAEADGLGVWRAFVNRQTPRADRRPQPPAGARVWAIDGWCHLAPRHRWRLRRLARSRGAGLLGTAHLCGWGLPVLHRSRASPEVLAVLIARLDPDRGIDAAALLAAHGGNARDGLFFLYDEAAGRRRREGVRASRCLPRFLAKRGPVFAAQNPAAGQPNGGVDSALGSG